MAKKTNNNVQWKTAAYIRLSREDGDKTESESVVNQKRLIYDFIRCQPDLGECREFVEMKIAKMIQFENAKPRQKARNKGFRHYPMCRKSLFFCSKF